MVEFKKIDDDPIEKFYNRYEAIVDGRAVWVGLYQVMFGWRVVMSYTGDNGYLVNWCCGDNQAVIALTQKVLMNLLERGVPIRDIPFCSDIKPWPNDQKFIDRIDKLMEADRAS